MEHFLTTTAKLQTEQATRACETLQNTVQLASAPPAPGAMAEVLELAGASYKRAADLQIGWLRDWTRWGLYAQSLDGANTVPKYVERVGNIALQAQAQVNAQAEQWSELMDNVGVSYGFWLTRQLEARDKGGS
ncbi:hypothetical protein PGB28_02855 [Primorskyibacter aestuariivivens]|uniref:hypothetical protein n=1 Tax=Primorskyibacter aestuariivivens TaxID=1888912 RepID=UPI0023000E90|nr:hypothetical protein [Primorskyibacter aestuariivivens]MDA7427384.1 hypothetical protein [Primorskyibacter aestuariivivens]